MKLLKLLTRDPAQVEALRACLHENRPYRLLEMKLFVTRRCNLRCRMCNAWRSDRAGEAGELSSGELSRVIAEARALGLEKLRLFGGEPLLRGDLEGVVAHASSLGVQVHLVTNGVLLGEIRARALLNAGLAGVELSLDALEAGVHEDVRGVAGAWERTVSGLKRLRALADAQGLPLRIGVNTVVMRQNYLELPELGRRLEEWGVDAWTLIPVTPQADNPRGGAGDYLLGEADIRRYHREVLPRLSQDESIRRLSDLTGLDVFGGQGADQAAAAGGRYVERLGVMCCYKPWYYAVVRENGDVLGCNTVKDPLRRIGNLRERSLAELWSSERYAEFRERCQPPRLAGCERCCYHIALRNLRIEQALST